MSPRHHIRFSTRQVAEFQNFSEVFPAHLRFSPDPRPFFPLRPFFHRETPNARPNLSDRVPPYTPFFTRQGLDSFDGCSSLFVPSSSFPFGLHASFWVFLPPFLVMRGRKVGLSFSLMLLLHGTCQVSDASVTSDASNGLGFLMSRAFFILPAHHPLEGK